MDSPENQPFNEALLKEQFRALSRPELDARLNQFGGQHAALCQQLEALYSPDRLKRFIAIRPGGLDEIDKAIALANPTHPKELTLLNSFRKLNQILLPFMDVYEEKVLGDLQYMSTDELKRLEETVEKELASAQAQQKQPTDYRRTQNASGTLRLAVLFKDGIEAELKRRTGFEII